MRRLLLADVEPVAHVASRTTYGVRRMKASLWHEHGLIVNRKLIERIMREGAKWSAPTEEGTAQLGQRRHSRRLSPTQRLGVLTELATAERHHGAQTKQAKELFTAAWCSTCTRAEWWDGPLTGAMKRHW